MESSSITIKNSREEKGTRFVVKHVDVCERRLWTETYFSYVILDDELFGFCSSETFRFQGDFSSSTDTGQWDYLEEVTAAPLDVYSVTGIDHQGRAWLHVLLFLCTCPRVIISLWNVVRGLLMLLSFLLLYCLSHRIIENGKQNHSGKWSFVFSCFPLRKNIHAKHEV